MRRLIAKDFPVPGPASTRIRGPASDAIRYAGDVGSRWSLQAIQCLFKSRFTGEQPVIYEVRSDRGGVELLSAPWTAQVSH